MRIAEQYCTGEIKITRIPLWRMGLGLIWRSIVCTICVCALVFSSVMEMRGKWSPLFQVIISAVLFSFFILFVRRYARNWAKTTTNATKAEDVGNEKSNVMRVIMTYLNSDEFQDPIDQSSAESQDS